MKLSLLMNSYTLICLWILEFPIGIIEVSTSSKGYFLLYVSSLLDYWPPSTWNSLVNISCVEMERCEKEFFSPSKCEKKISLNIKTKCVTDYYWQLGLRVWRIILVITGWAHKRQTFKLISIKIFRIWKFFVYN